MLRVKRSYCKNTTRHSTEILEIITMRTFLFEFALRSQTFSSLLLTESSSSYLQFSKPFIW